MSKHKKTKLLDITIDELSGVDHPAQEHAKVLLMKRKNMSEEFAKRGVWLTTSVDGHSHLVGITPAGAGDTSWSVAEGDEHGHDHPWVKNEDGSFTVGDASGHTHAVIIPTEVEKADASASKTVGLPDKDNTQGETMSEKNESAARIQSLEAELSKSKAQGERLGKVVQLSESDRLHFLSLQKEGQDAFLKLERHERAAQVTKALESDPVVYTSPNGTEYRKSADPAIISAVRQGDEAMAMAKHERSLREGMQLRKRAEDLKTLPGETEVKMAVLKALDGIEDEEIRKKAHTLLEAHAINLAPAFQTVGVSKTASTSSASVEFFQKVEELVKQENIAEHEAQDRLKKSHPALYSKAVQGL